ncbi:MAG: PPK2 family polyphosphate kinase [Gemmatimonadota bacterium]
MSKARNHYRVEGGAVKLKNFDPGARPYSVGSSRDEDRAWTAELAKEIAAYQDNFYALRREKLLIVLQGMDTSGKDGTIRSVFQAVDPLGVRAVSYRAPTDPEKQRDFLWRHHRDVPGVGEIVIFNRSHYEAVLIEYVHGWIDKEERKRRLKHINTFERLLTDTGTTVVKFFLHISKDEQRRRLQERIDDPAKNWKFNMQDLQERKLWDAYQRAYEMALEETGTRLAPWYVVPSDSKTHRNLMVSTILLDLLKRLAPKPPPAIKELAGVKVR